VLDQAEFEAIKTSDLAILAAPYVVIGIVLVVMFVLFAIFLPKAKDTQTAQTDSIGKTACRLWNNKRYRYGVVAQFFYVGVQIMCWTFIIQYGTRVFMNEGMTELEAEVASQRYNIVAMVIFCVSRFVCTWLMKYVKASKLLAIFAAIAIALTACVVFADGRLGIYCLVAISACMSLMFPTIYGIALEGVGNDAKLGAAGLIMAILGGSILPPLQATIIDEAGILGLPSVNVSFVVPLICFVVIMIYARATLSRDKRQKS
jgi:FHS family L-fucose permease-like MFS transporter